MAILVLRVTNISRYEAFPVKQVLRPAAGAAELEGNRSLGTRIVGRGAGRVEDTAPEPPDPRARRFSPLGAGGAPVATGPLGK